MSQFTKTMDFLRKPEKRDGAVVKSRFMNFDGERYSVSLDFSTIEKDPEAATLEVRRPAKTNCYMAIRTHSEKVDESMRRFMPYLSVLLEDEGPNYIPEEVVIQTTSYGTLPIAQYKKMLEIERLAAEDAEAIYEEFIKPIREGTFNCDAMPEGGAQE